MKLTPCRSLSRRTRTCVVWTIALALAVPLLSRLTPANADYLFGEKARFWQRLEEMQWQDRLSAADMEKVVEGLKSKSPSLEEEALKVVAIHRLSALAPVVQATGVEYEIRTVAGLLTEAFHSGQDPVAALRTLLVENRLEKKWTLRNPHSIPVKDILVSIVAIDEAKILRKGGRANPGMEEANLNAFANKLLHYSRMKPESAVDDIFEKLSNIEFVGPDAGDLTLVLQSYGEKAVIRLINKLSNVHNLNSMSGYGISQLLEPLALYVNIHPLDAASAKKLNMLISRLERNASPHVVDQVQQLRSYVEKERGAGQEAE